MSLFLGKAGTFWGFFEEIIMTLFDQFQKHHASKTRVKHILTPGGATNAVSV
jgi:hypothetical protein